MSSGRKRSIANFRERLISNDVNQAQSFKDAAAQQLLRFLLDDTYSDALKAPGVNTQHSAVEAPLRAVVTGGLIPEPVIGTQINVSPGVMMAIFPSLAAGVDDSPYVFVDDAGSTSDPAMVFTANAGPGIRIDVIECQPVDTVTAVDGRDIFDPSSGLFVPTVVNKAAKATLQYRIRLGTPGSGYPGHASGWLPLAIASVPSGAVDWTTCTFWDVRPLISERGSHGSSDTFSTRWKGVRGYATLSRQNPDRLIGAIWNDSSNPVPASASLPGGPYISGGFLRPGVPGIVDVDYFELSDVNNQSATFVPTNGSFYAVSAFFPHDLPRWVRYSEALIAGRRLPWGTRGILQVHTAGTLLETGRTGATQLNVITGLTGNHRGINLFIALYDGGSYGYAEFNDGEIWFSNEKTLLPAIHTPGGAGGVSTLAITPGTSFPHPVYQALFEITMNASGWAGGPDSETSRIELMNNAQANTQILELVTLGATVGANAGQNVFNSRTLWVPIPHNAFPASGSAASHLRYTRTFGNTIGGGTTTAANWTIRAIRLNPT